MKITKIASPMSRNKITFLLYGETPYEQTVQSLNKKECKDILEALKIDEGIVQNQEGTQWTIWAATMGMSGEQLKERKLSDIHYLINVTQKRLNELGEKKL